MNIRRTTLACVAAVLGAGLLIGCGGSYGSGNSNPVATLSISVSPTTITLGQSATISWTSNAPCTASGAWSGTKGASGTETVTPAAAGTLTYTLTCVGSGYRESPSRSATLTVNPTAVAGLWVGDGCCVNSESFPVTGMTNDSGDYRFLVLGTHYVGKAGEAPVAYSTCSACLAGQRKADEREFRELAITPRVSAHGKIRATGLTAPRKFVEFSAPYDRAFERSSGGLDLEGIYTTHLGTGYTLTVVLDAAGRVSGIDTNGCSLQGEVSGRHPRFNYYDLTLEVNHCADRNGRYDGHAALIGDAAGRATELFLLTSNAEAAIGWRLSR